MFALADLVDHVVQYSGRDNTRAKVANAVAAARLAVAALGPKHDWNWYRTSLTIALSPDYSTGTIQYVASTRTLTLTGGTWPTWAIYGIIRINSIDYEIDTRTSGTVLVLSTNSAPADDISTDTTYALRRYAYQLPEHFDSIYYVAQQPSGCRLKERRISDAPAVWRQYDWIRSFAILADRFAQGRMILITGQTPDQSGVLQALYKRRMPALRYDKYTDASGSNVAVSATAVTGVNTLFRSDMVGQIFRASFDNQNDPTGEFGNNVYAHESLIDAVGGDQSLTLRTAIGTALTKSKWCVSSLIDIAYGPMWEYLLREVEKQFRSVNRMQPYNREELSNYAEALITARENDSRYNGLHTVEYGLAGWYPAFNTDVPLEG